MSGKDQRKFVRIPATIIIELHTPDSVTKLGKGCVTDMSLGGMGFESEAELKENTEVFLTFNMPVDVQGKIVHIKKNGVLVKYGVRFTKIGDIEKSHIKKYVTAKFKR